MRTTLLVGLAAAALAVGTPAAAQDATFAVKLLTPETALKAAQAALKKCRDEGYQVAVAVVDRMGVTQVMLRDRYAGPHTPTTASGKAWTAVSFRTNSGEFAKISQAGMPQSGVRQIPGVVAIGGGLLIEGGGSLFGAIGVSGAPGGEADDACAAAGIAVIKDSLEF